MLRTIFHVDMDSFFASCEQQADPRLRGRPIAVSGDPKSRTVVAAASKEAKQWGVKSGMTVRDARALCPHIQFVLGDPDKYVDVSRRVISRTNTDRSDTMMGVCAPRYLSASSPKRSNRFRSVSARG